MNKGGAIPPFFAYAKKSRQRLDSPMPICDHPTKSGR